MRIRMKVSYVHQNTAGDGDDDGWDGALKSGV
jgi:hypothetical protein